MFIIFSLVLKKIQLKEQLILVLIIAHQSIAKKQIITKEKILKYMEQFKSNNSSGDWGLGIGDWGLGPIPNPQSPIPNPHLKLLI